MGVQGFNMITLKIAARRLAVAAAIFPWLITAAMAQPDGGASCNPTLDVNLEDGPFFLNQPIQASADLGAGDVVGGTRLDITQFSYGLDCMAGQDFDTCTADGNTVIFNGVDSTSCVDALGDPVVFSTTPNGVFVDFTPMSGQPLRIMSNQSCNVQFNFTVTALNGADNLIFQTMGWDADDVECDTDPISNSGISSNLAFGISLPPQLTLVKEVVNDNGGTAAATEWILTASGSGGFSGPGVGDPSQAVNGPNEVEAGVTYALSESGPTGYDTDGYICVGDGVFDDAAQTITLDFNESATCTIVNDDFPLARFAVTKDFSDDNSQEVLVQVSCNTGLPLYQEKLITEFDGGVVFVVGDYLSGTMDCEASEVVPGGYSQSYLAGTIDGVADSIYEDEDGCYYDGVFGGTFTCEITNTLDPVEVLVEKVWIDENPQYQGSTVVEITLQCDSQIVGGYMIGSYWYIEAYIDPQFPGLFLVYPLFTGTTCVATEEPIVGVLTDQSDCEHMELFPGIGDSCVIYNTRLYAGIPTINRNGLVLLVLLILGVGAVAYRRLN
jgi:hypothetical protein